eukprot:4262029-Pyramimonas_sp.AAC.1
MASCGRECSGTKFMQAYATEKSAKCQEELPNSPHCAPDHLCTDIIDFMPRHNQIKCSKHNGAELSAQELKYPIPKCQPLPKAWCVKC